MKQKQAVTKQLALSYKRAGKKEKGKILDTVIELTGYNRSYASRVLRQRARPRQAFDSAFAHGSCKCVDIENFK